MYNTIELVYATKNSFCKTDSVYALKEFNLYFLKDSVCRINGLEYGPKDNPISILRHIVNFDTFKRTLPSVAESDSPIDGFKWYILHLSFSTITWELIDSTFCIETDLYYNEVTDLYYNVAQTLKLAKTIKIKPSGLEILHNYESIDQVKSLYYDTLRLLNITRSILELENILHSLEINNINIIEINIFYLGIKKYISTQLD